MGRIPSLIEARGLISKPNNDKVTRYADGITPDIQNEILETARISAGSTVALAKVLRGSTPMESARNIHKFARQIKYQLDPDGHQWVKTPARTVWDQFSDCKSYSILIHSLLSDLGIKNWFRFHAYRSIGPVTHIFNVALIGGRETVIDACLSKFGEEAPHTRAENIMPQISRLSGIGLTEGESANLGSILGTLSENGIPAIMEIEPSDSELLATIKGLAETTWHEANAVAGIEGPESPGHNSLLEGVSDYVAAIQAIENPNVSNIAALERIAQRIEARIPVKHRRFFRAMSQFRKGSASGEDFRVLRAMRKARQNAGIKGIGEGVGIIGRKRRRGNFFKRAAAALKKAAKKTGQGLKKAGKGVVNVVKKVAFAPLRLAIRVLLPKAAPFFLYLFITNPDTIKALPAKVARKRRKAVSISKFIINGLGMKESLFMRQVRNGIMRKYKASPEQVLARTIQGKINGIGAGSSASGSAPGGGGSATGANALAAVGPLMEIIKTIKSLFGKAPDEGVSEDDAPSSDDFEETPVRTKRKVLTHLTRKSYSERGEEPGAPEEEAAMQTADSDAQSQVDAEPDSTSLEDPLPEPAEAAEENF